MAKREPELIASVRYRTVDGRAQFEIFKVGRRYKLVSKDDGESFETPFTNRAELEALLRGYADFDTPNRDCETACMELVGEFIARTEFKPDPVDMLLQESKLKNPFL